MKKLYHSFTRQLLTFAILTTSLAMLSACGPAGITATYTAPGWAPEYADVSSVPYYYFPDYDMYYDVGAGEYYYLNNGVWSASVSVPFPGVDAGSAYTVLLGRGTSRPWDRDDYYRRNYPAHAHEQYQHIVMNNHMVNVPDGHTLMPRAFNENTNRVTFEERAANNRSAGRIASHEVPMRSIAPNMPAESHNFRYGGSERGR